MRPRPKRRKQLISDMPVTAQMIEDEYPKMAPLVKEFLTSAKSSEEPTSVWLSRLDSLRSQILRMYWPEYDFLRDQKKALLRSVEFDQIKTHPQIQRATYLIHIVHTIQGWVKVYWHRAVERLADELGRGVEETYLRVRGGPHPQAMELASRNRDSKVYSRLLDQSEVEAWEKNQASASRVASLAIQRGCSL